MIPENTTLKANSSLYIVSDNNLAASLSEFSPAVGNLFFDISPGDSIILLSPLLSPVTSAICYTILPVNYEPPELIINEINYHSNNDFNTGDWLEFYNPNTVPLNVSGWVFKDENDAHIFVFPQGTRISALGYLVICEDKTRFSELFPSVSTVAESFNFGLANEGELLRLYDSGGAIVDSVRYDDNPPWPTEADGNGHTLELIDSESENSLAENWGVSLEYGTPGVKNSVTLIIREPDCVPEAIILKRNFPNPFNGETSISYNVPGEVRICVEIYNIRGQLVETLYPERRQQQVIWKPVTAGSGIYFITLVVDGQKQAVQKALLLK